jgi:NTE family protein
MGLFGIGSKKSKIAGLALGGGGARGYGHLGVLKSFAEAGLDFPIVAGTSAGSIVGALYSAGAAIDDIIAASAAIEEKDIMSGLIPFRKSAEKIETVLRRYLGDMEFPQLNKKFAAVATDLIEAKEAILTEGRVAKAVSASCAVPGVFRPVVMNGMHLVDGGIFNNIPSDVARVLGADFVVAVDVNPTRGYGTQSLGTLDVLRSCLRMLMSQNAVKGIANADIYVSVDLRDFSFSKKAGYEEMIEAGYKAGKEIVPKIKEALF